MGTVFRHITATTVISLATLTIGLWISPPAQTQPNVGREWSAPLLPVEVHRGFQPPPSPWAAGHRGVDLAGEPEQEVYAAAAGTVIYADDLADRGVVSIQHPQGWRTSYEPVRADVTEGQTVEAGELIGVLDGSHRDCHPREPCLHWGARLWGQYVDPLWLVGMGEIRLLPRPGLLATTGDDS